MWIKKRRNLPINKLLELPTTREARLWSDLGGNRVQCLTCERKCVIPEGKTGFCGTRMNIDGVLYVLTYGDISSISNNPMEKKPFFHFLPGKYALTIGSWSCNFKCPWCQNWEISMFSPLDTAPNYVAPQKFISIMKRISTHATSFSFNEPLVSLFEYSLDVMPLAKKQGYFNTYVTNGYMTEEALDLLIKHGLDAACVNIKACPGTHEKWTNGAKVEYVWRNVKIMLEKKIHVELVTLVIPSVNDSEKCLRYIARRIKDDLGDFVPWHLTRYFEAYRAREYGLPPNTPIETLRKAYRIAKEEGLKWVYLGNVWDPQYESTFCPNCGKLLIARYIYDIIVHIDEPRCPHCGELIPIILLRSDGKVIDWRST